jgi:hypothetical protein
MDTSKNNLEYVLPTGSQKWDIYKKIVSLQHNKALSDVFMRLYNSFLEIWILGQLLAVLVALPTYAQYTVLLKQERPSYELTPQVQTLYDTIGKLTFEQVSSPTMQARFKHESKSKREIHTHWYKIELDNQTTETHFQVASSSLFQSELYVVQGGQTYHYTNGFRTKAKDKAYLGDIFQYPVMLPKGKTTLYFVDREATTYQFRVGKEYFDLFTAKEAFISFQRYQTLFWLILGVFSALICYNAILYAILHDRAYLYYVLSVVSLAGYILFIDRVTLNNFDVSEFYYIRLSHILGNISIGLLGVFFIKFTRLYLNTRDQYPTWDTALRYFPVLLYGSTVFIVSVDLLKAWRILYIPSWISVGTHTFCLASAAACLLVLSGRAWFKGGIINRYYVYSNAVFLVGALIFASAHPAFGLYKPTFYTASALKVGMAIQMIAFSIALANRINILKQEIADKELAQEHFEKEITAQKNAELEQKVKDRTRDLEQSNEEIRTQASEIERQARLLEDQKNRQLMNKTLEILQKNELMPEVGKFLEKLSPQLDDRLKQESKELQKKMTQNLHADAHWENLKLHFEETHPNLFAVLHERCPKLSPNDLRHCAYQKMGLSKKEIASLLNLDPASVNKQQYRIKQKLQLDEEVSFADFIMGIH